jgi:hypothetical protein
MAETVSLRHLNALGYSNGFTLWHYNAPMARHTRDDVESEGFFSPIADMLAKGDMILITFEGSGTIRFVARTEAPGIVLVALT